MTDPRENCPWKCKHCKCYQGEIDRLSAENSDMREVLKHITRKNLPGHEWRQVMAQDCLDRHTASTARSEALDKLAELDADLIGGEHDEPVLQRRGEA